MSAELVAEWVRKAEEDWTALARLEHGGPAAVANAMTFHAQQCAEKCLKALIQQGGVEPPRTHHLPTLLDMLVAACPEIEDLRVACESLAPYAVHFRYPGQEASVDDALEAVSHAERVRNAVRTRLGLGGD